jgi:hypothetical protein
MIAQIPATQPPAVHAPAAIVRFDSTAVARNRRFGVGVIKADRPFFPEQADWNAYRELLETEHDREIDDRFLAYEYEDQSAGRYTEADAVAAGLAV